MEGTQSQGYVKVSEKEELSGRPVIEVPPNVLHKPTLLGARLKMLLLFFVGLAAMGAHHAIYTVFDGRLTNDSPLAPFHSMFHKSVNSQSFANAVGNAISTVGKLCFAGAIGAAFIQIFWWRMRRQGFCIQQVDQVMGYKANIVDVTAWSTLWNRDTVWLSVVATTASLLVAITIVTPGSLTVETMSLPSTHSVPTVNLATADLNETSLAGSGLYNGQYVYPGGKTVAFVTRVLMMGDYIPPTSPCGICEYNVSFVAPAVQCTNITNNVNWQDWLPDGFDYSTVWNSTQTEVSTDQNLLWHLSVSSRNLLPYPGQIAYNVSSDMEVLDCVGYSAKYHVNVQQNLTTTMNVIGIDMGDELNQMNETGPLIIQLLSIWNALAQQLTGTVEYYVDWNGFEGTPAVVAYSPLVSAGNGWQWQESMMTAIPSLMKNISLSLLSSDLSSAGSSTISSTDTTCEVTGLYFVYNRTRLLATYASCIVITIICIVFGFIAVSFNGVGETMDFSRLLGGIFDFKDEFVTYRHANDLSLGTKVMADPDGVIRPSLK